MEGSTSENLSGRLDSVNSLGESSLSLLLSQGLKSSLLRGKGTAHGAGLLGTEVHRDVLLASELLTQLRNQANSAQLATANNTN